MDEAPVTKEFEAGLSLLHMMQHPSEPSTPTMKKRAGGSLNGSRVAKKQRTKAALATGALLLAAAQQVDPAANDENEEDDEDDETDDDQARGLVRRNMQLNSLTHELNINELREHFNKPIVEVAKAFGICTTFLKKICRRCGIKRWPHRQIRSLTRTIEMLHQAEANATSIQEKAKYAAQIAHVEAKKRAVIDDPDANGKLERVKKSVLSRSGSPGGRKNSSDAGSKTNAVAASEDVEPEVQAGLLHAVAAAAAAAATGVVTTAAMAAPFSTSNASLSTIVKATDAEAAAAEALLFSASPRSTVASIDVTMPSVSLDGVALPAVTPKAASTPDASPLQGLKISPCHRKLLTVSKNDSDLRVQTASLGSLSDLVDAKSLEVSRMAVVETEDRERPCSATPQPSMVETS